MSATPLRSLAAKLEALDLTEAEAQLLHTIIKQAALDESEVVGFAAGMEFPNFSLVDPVRLRRLANLDGCDDEPTQFCAPPSLR